MIADQQRFSAESDIALLRIPSTCASAGCEKGASVMLIMRAKSGDVVTVAACKPCAETLRVYAMAREIPSC